MMLLVEILIDKVLQRKVDKYRNKVLYTEKVFQRNSLIPVVAWPERKIKKSKKPVHESADSKAQVAFQFSHL